MHGLREPITVFEDMILDGRNRYRACLEAGIEPTSTAYIGDDPQGFVVSMNMHRRHLTAEQKREKRELIAKLLQANPTKSDRQIAKAVKTSPTTVGKVRSAMEAKGEVSKVDTRTDAKGVKQPAKKKQRPKHTEVAPTAVVKPVPVPDTKGSWRVEVIDDGGKRWTNGARLGTKKEASAYLGWAIDALRKHTTLMELRVVPSDDRPNVSITFGKTGYPTLVFPDGQCGMLGWAVETELPVSVSVSTEANPIIPAWDKASGKQRQDFVRARDPEITFAQQRIGASLRRPEVTAATDAPEEQASLFPCDSSPPMGAGDAAFDTGTINGEMLNYWSGHDTQKYEASVKQLLAGGATYHQITSAMQNAKSLISTVRLRGRP